MSWGIAGILIIMILGVALFLYGSNVYGLVLGWSGVFLIVGGIVVYLAWEAYKALGKRGS